MSSNKRKSEFSESKKTKNVKKCVSENKLKEICTIFLNSKKNANLLVDLLDQFQIPSETSAKCMCAVENIFSEVLKRKDMAAAETDNEAESQYKKWLSGCYEDALANLALCLQSGFSEGRLQAMNSLFKLLSQEAKYPINKIKKKKKKTNFPIRRLQKIIQALYMSTNICTSVLDRLAEYFEYKDIGCNTWLAVENLAKELMQHQPADTSVWNLLMMLSRIPKTKSSQPDVYFCVVKNVMPEERVVRMAVTGLWQHLRRWQYKPATQQLLLVVLVERMMPLMDNVIYLTDYFMDSLAREECEINMLALQGIFNLVVKHNIEYPNIYGKLYQLFTEDALQAKYKTRLYALADEFLRSTHLPLGLVAAFAKRFSRLLLSATPPDSLVLLTFIANLMIRHPDLQFLCHKPNGKQVEADSYCEDQRDPQKSGAAESQLWEVGLMRHHYCERVARLATTITSDLPSAEYPLEPLLDTTWTEIISKGIKQLKKNIPKIAEKFDNKPLSTKMAAARQTEINSMFANINQFFILS